MLTSEIKQKIIAHSHHYPSIEVCGVITVDGEVVECENIADNPQEQFVISLKGIDQKIAAIYHTHWQDSQPALLSPIDIANSKATKLPYILYHTGFGQWDYYNPSDIYPYPLIPKTHFPQKIDYYFGLRFL